MELQNPRTPDQLRADADEREREAVELRQTARAEAEQHVLDADKRADEMCRTARDYRAIADEQDASRPPVACWNCPVPIVPFSLGWKHVAEGGCDTPEPAPAEPTAVDVPSEQAPAAGSEATA